MARLEYFSLDFPANLARVPAPDEYPLRGLHHPAVEDVVIEAAPLLDLTWEKILGDSIVKFQYLLIACAYSRDMTFFFGGGGWQNVYFGPAFPPKKNLCTVLNFLISRHVITGTINCRVIISFLPGTAARPRP